MIPVPLIVVDLQAEGCLDGHNVSQELVDPIGEERPDEEVRHRTLEKWRSKGGNHISPCGVIQRGTNDRAGFV